MLHAARFVQHKKKTKLQICSTLSGSLGEKEEKQRSIIIITPTQAIALEWRIKCIIIRSTTGKTECTKEREEKST